MSTTAPQPATTPIPVQLSEPEFTAFIFPHLSLPKRGPKCKLGCTRVLAIFGVQSWRWDWVREVRELVFALDADAAGQQQWRALARQAALRGKRVAVLPPAAYGGCKDVSEAWAAGVLAVGEKLGREQPEKLRELWEERM